MPRRNPPEHLIDRHMLEPLLAPFHHRQMIGGAIDEGRERIDIAPHRHVRDQVRIVGYRHVGRIIALARQPPYETVGGFGDSIHMVEPVPEDAVGAMPGWQAKAPGLRSGEHTYELE